MLMEQDLCWPKQTSRGLSLEFIRHWEEGRKKEQKEETGGRERQGRRGSEEQGGSMLFIKQEGLRALKFVRGEPQAVYRKSIQAQRVGRTKYPGYPPSTKWRKKVFILEIRSPKCLLCLKLMSAESKPGPNAALISVLHVRTGTAAVDKENAGLS